MSSRSASPRAEGAGFTGTTSADPRPMARHVIARVASIPRRLFATSTHDKALQQIAVDRKLRPTAIVTGIAFMIGGELTLPEIHLVPPTFAGIVAIVLLGLAGRAYERSPSRPRLLLTLLLGVVEASCVAMVIWQFAAFGGGFGLIMSLLICHLWIQAACNIRSIDMRFFFAMIIPAICGAIAAIPFIDQDILPPEARPVCIAISAFAGLINLRTGWVAHNVFDDMLRARDRATTAVVLKERVLATVSHEIRTSLNGIMGVGQMMMTAGNENERGRASTILSSAKTMKSLLDDLLDHAKLQSGQFVVRSVSTAPDPILREVVALFRDSAAARGVTLELRVDPKLPPAILCDPGRLRQIVSNLLSNAVKHTSDGHIAVTATFEEGDRMVVRVRDTGAGIAPADLDRVFEPFGQLDDKAAQDSGGTGLGLAVSREMARMMNGELSVSSRPGEGSTFILDLPATLGKVNRTDHAPRPANLAGLTALLVDDIKVNRMIARSFLERADMTVLEAADGVAAVEVLKSDAVDVVITDLHMPNMGGEALLQAIRADPKLPRLPVVLLSAGHGTALAGFDATLSKPVDCRELQATIGRIM